MEIDIKGMLPDALKRLYVKKHGALNKNESEQIDEFCRELICSQIDFNSPPCEEILQIYAIERVEELSHEIRLIIANLLELMECTWSKGIQKYTTKAIINHQKLLKLTKEKDYGVIASATMSDFYKSVNGKYELHPDVVEYIKKPSMPALNNILLKKQGIGK